MKISIDQAKRFMLLKHGLYGGYQYQGKEGIIDFVTSVGCIQYDPIDICGKNHEIILQSRIKDFRKDMLYQLLYDDRKLIDGFDKNMSIYLLRDWPYFNRKRTESKNNIRSREETESVEKKIIEIIKMKGPIASKDLNFNEKVDWSWAPTNLSRAALERLYDQGDLVIHHKNNTRKYYDLSENLIDKEILQRDDPNLLDEEYFTWHVNRRIKSVGMLWNKSSDAFLGINGFKAKDRISAFNTLIDQGKIIPLDVEGIDEILYISCEDQKYLSYEDTSIKRMEFIAPLDNLIWDRKLIKALFNFEYKWEIYTPKDKRKYGYYVLPILYGNHFIGRIELKIDKKSKQLILENIWWEDSKWENESIREILDKTLDRFSNFNNMTYDK